MRTCCGIVAAVFVLIPAALGQTTPTTLAVPEQKSPLHVEIATFFSALSRGYDDWRGVDLRLLYTMKRATPIVAISHQTRAEGSHSSVSIGSYVTLTDRSYAVVGVSHAPRGEVELYPLLRVDAAVLTAIPGVSGLVVSGGITDIRGAAPRTGGNILSVGSLYYRGSTISQAVVRFNRDRRSGAWSRSELIATQLGAQGRYWIGASVSHGTEAYEVAAVTPFDARWEGVGASVFVQRWLGTDHGFTVRYDYEHKFEAFVRNGVTLSYFVDF